MKCFKSVSYFLLQGNFVNRALKFCKENFGGQVVEVKLSPERGDDAVIALVNRYLASYVEQVLTPALISRLADVFSALKGLLS